METCDVLVVGGGPAGSSCAWRLRQQGMDVMVMDKAEFPRDKVCAGWITPAVVHSLQLDTYVYAREHVLQRISAFRTGMIDGKELETHYPTPVSYGIRRSEFDDYLLRRSGARLKLGQPLDSMERNGSQWLINNCISTPMVVGAGGHFCPVARNLGARLGAEEQSVLAKEIEFEMTLAQECECSVRADTPELYFCADMKGYGWCFRKGSFLNIGLGREAGIGLNEQLDGFCNFLGKRGRISHRIPKKFHGHAYILYGNSRRKLMEDGVLLIGDAAGLAYPQSGEGIRPAVESGLMAAAAIMEARGDYSSQQLMYYPIGLRKRFGAPNGNGSAASGNGSPGIIRKLVSEALLESRWFTRHVLLDRWFLHAGIPEMKVAPRSRNSVS